MLLICKALLNHVALRLYPSVPVNPRTALGTTVLPRGGDPVHDCANHPKVPDDQTAGRGNCGIAGSGKANDDSCHVDYRRL